MKDDKTQLDKMLKLDEKAYKTKYLIEAVQSCEFRALELLCFCTCYLSSRFLNVLMNIKDKLQVEKVLKYFLTISFIHIANPGEWDVHFRNPLCSGFQAFLKRAYSKKFHYDLN